MKKSKIINSKALTSPEFQALIEKHGDQLFLFFHAEVIFMWFILALRDDAKLDKKTFEKIIPFLSRSHTSNLLSMRYYFNLDEDQLKTIMDDIAPYVPLCIKGGPEEAKNIYKDFH